ncbi:MAG: aspartate dehydrogenase [Lachnospiraceae bacterium]|nr:aspartate dehydrogenase [Lachnospiraceae bacterium]
MLFHKKKNRETLYDTTGKYPVIHASICTGERVAGFKDEETGKFDELMLIRSEEDIDTFARTYTIEKDSIRKEW